MYTHQTTNLQKHEAEPDEADSKSHKCKVIVEDFTICLRNSKNCYPENQQGYRRSDTTINQQDLTDVYRTIHPTIAEYNFFMCPWIVHQDRTHSGP